MNGDFGKVINQLQNYEKEIDVLWQEYNPSDSCLKMELLAMKMTIAFYNYLTTCFESLSEVNKKRLFDLARISLTILSYGLTGISVFKAPIISIPSLLGSICLSIKNNKYNMSSSDNEEKIPIDDLLDMLDNFENHYLPKIDTIMERIDILEDDKILSSYDEPEQSKRIACKRLMQFLRTENQELIIENKQFTNYLTDIINDSLNTDKKDVYELIQDADNYYQKLDLKLTRLNKKNEKLSLFCKFF